MASYKEFSTGKNTLTAVPPLKSSRVNEGFPLTYAKYIGTEDGSTVEEKLSTITSAGLKFETVTELPSSPDSGTIYLKAASTTGTNNKYEEYVYSNNTWEKLGTEVKIDAISVGSTDDNFDQNPDTAYGISNSVFYPIGDITAIYIQKYQDGGNSGEQNDVLSMYDILRGFQVVTYPERSTGDLRNNLTITYSPSDLVDESKVYTYNDKNYASRESFYEGLTAPEKDTQLIITATYNEQVTATTTATVYGLPTKTNIKAVAGEITSRDDDAITEWGSDISEVTFLFNYNEKVFPVYDYTVTDDKELISSGKLTPFGSMELYILSYEDVYASYVSFDRSDDNPITEDTEATFTFTSASHPELTGNITLTIKKNSEE